MARAGKYKSVRTQRPIECIHARNQIPPAANAGAPSATSKPLQLATMDLVLEGQAALIYKVMLSMYYNLAAGDFEADFFFLTRNILTMDEDFNSTLAGVAAGNDQTTTVAGGLSVVQEVPALDDEDTIWQKDFMLVNQEQGTPASTQALMLSQNVESDYPFGILVPETLRFVTELIESSGALAADTFINFDLWVWYKRIENPSSMEKDYLYRRR